MRRAGKVGTTSLRTLGDDEQPGIDEYLYEGDLEYTPDGDIAMVWDTNLGNIRSMNSEEGAIAQRAAILAAIDAHANAIRNEMTAGVTPAEMASWSIKRGEALSYQGDPAACPMLSAEAAARDVPLAAIVDRVLAAAGVLSAVEAAIAGTAGRHKDAVRAAQAPAGYDWSAGWPA